MDSQIQEIFKDAQQNIAKGDMTMALSCCNKINDQGTKYPEIYRMYGYIDMYKGSYDSAFENYRTAISLATNKEVYIYDLMVAYTEADQCDQAIEFGNNADLLDSDNILALLSIAYIKKSDLKKSIEYYKKIKNLDVASPFISNLKGIMSVKAGNYDNAIQHFQEALKLKPDYIDCYLNLGFCFIETKRPVNALMNNKHALNIRPVNKLALENVIYLCREYGIMFEGVPHMLKAISLGCANPSLYIFLASIYNQKKDSEKALQYCDEAIRIKKDFIHSYDMKAKILEIMGKLDEARSTINEGLNYNQNHPGFYHTLAMIQLREEQYEEAYNNCNKAIELNNSDTRKHEILDTKAKILDKLKRHSEAYKTFSTVQTYYKKLWGARNIQNNNFFNKGLEKYFTKENMINWNYNDYNGKSPVFFMGFPRSGTTLVEKILSCHSNNLVSSEEASATHLVNNIKKILSNNNFNYPYDIDNLSKSDLDKLRNYYWETIKKESFKGKDIEDKCIIDKYPMNTVHLGFIYRLFPNSKIIFAIRDPRDVCLSCFFQSFTHNNAMLNFYTLEDTVNFYDNVMDLYLKLRDIVPLDIKEYRYEDMIEDQEHVLKGLFEFIEQPWEEEVMQFYKKKRQVNTPSYIGVDKPIYKTAMQRWKNYESELRPYLPKLERYIKEFGYENT